MGILLLMLVPMLLCGNDIYAEEKPTPKRRDLIIDGDRSPAIAEEKPATENISQKPEIFVQLGHTWHTNSIALSPDGKYLLTENKRDKTLKVWSAKFSPDGRYILADILNSKDFKLWDSATGKEVEK